MTIQPTFDMYNGRKATEPKWDVRKDWADLPTEISTADFVQMAQADPEIMAGLLCYLLNNVAAINDWRGR